MKYIWATDFKTTSNPSTYYIVMWPRSDFY